MKHIYTNHPDKIHTNVRSTAKMYFRYHINMTKIMIIPCFFFFSHNKPEAAIDLFYGWGGGGGISKSLESICRNAK